MCVGSVCTHPSYNDTNPPSVFKKIPILKSPFSNQAVLRVLSEWRSSAQAAPTIVDWQGRLTLDPPWMSWELSSVRHCVDSGAGEDKMSLIKRLRCFVVGCNNVNSSRHLLTTSELLKTQRININFVLKGMRRSPIYINASMFARIIRDPASSTEEVSITFFYESLQIAFPNNVLVSQFHG